MARKHNATGRSLTKGRFSMLPETVMLSAAYTKSTLAAKATLSEIALLYMGANNGFLGFSARQGQARLGCSKDTAARAYRELQSRGLIVAMRKGNFKAKTAPLASEWRLTWQKCDRSNQLATHDYRRWQPYIENPDDNLKEKRRKMHGQIMGTVRSDNADSVAENGTSRSDNGDSLP